MVGMPKELVPMACLKENWQKVLAKKGLRNGTIGEKKKGLQDKRELAVKPDYISITFTAFTDH